MPEPVSCIEYKPVSGFPSLLLVSSGSALTDISFMPTGLSAREALTALLRENSSGTLIAPDPVFESDLHTDSAAAFCDLFFSRGLVIIKDLKTKGGLLAINVNDGALCLTLDLDLRSPSERKILETLLLTPYGSRLSYADLAGAAGFPGGARFAGNVMAKNRFPVVIPCHRVVRSDGSPGRYTGGDHLKVMLLDHETLC